ncbi:uncharacterized protein LY89DRAFT_686925 [Mollisia scopiformis]|uniref:Uncharacterized protein n=1 Tax=Mollisia scopiformis TaxID=149040 RepID=A0A194X2N4_MOLSC|nr:uncharacterized protein LY89DRAFT_686925 [Mollisia scopiformis]KUJ14446.1 hypothetical protein LY89DRAFT_686925 [Mollisia scopiformis]
MESGRRRLNNHYSTAATGTEAIILTRILPRFQTIQERNFCALKYTNESHNPALLRTYYSDINGENKDEAHKIMVRDAILETCVHKDGNWNDKALYDFGDDWQRILLRMPELCDQEVGYGESENKEEDQEDLEAPPPDDREALESWLWSRNVAIRFYVRDREAMEKDLIKVFYLDTHGEAIWSHKFNAKSILQFNGAWYSMSLAEINGCFSGSRENGCELFL